jgi:hypothetical protein
MKLSSQDRCPTIRQWLNAVPENVFGQQPVELGNEKKNSLAASPTHDHQPLITDY